MEERFGWRQRLGVRTVKFVIGPDCVGDFVRPQTYDGRLAYLLGHGRGFWRRRAGWRRLAPSATLLFSCRI